MLPLAACVGQKDDLEPNIQDNPEETTGESLGSQFYRRVLALDFTATWCQYCPNMQDALEEAQTARPDRFVELSLHLLDEMSPEESEALATLFGVSGIPQMVFDWDVSTKFNQPELARFTKYADEAVKQEACGLAAHASIVNSQVELDVRVKPVQEGPCTVLAAIAEDGIVAYQTGYGDNYVNKAVIRSFLGGGLSGKPLSALKDGEGTVRFTAPAPASQENLYLVVFVLQDGKAVNVIRLGMNDTKDYEYEKDLE